MAKGKVRNQIGKLTPDHGKSRIDPIPLHVGDVGKLSMRATTSIQTSSQSEVYTRNYEPAKVAKVATLAISDRDKKPFGCHSHGEM
jgi:hypothetical protein